MNILQSFADAHGIIWSAFACVLVTLFFVFRSAVDDDTLKRAQQMLCWPSDCDGRVLKPSELGGISGGRLTCHDPSTLRLLGDVKVFSPAEVEAVIGRARSAQKAWAATSFGERRRVMRVLLQLVLDNADRIASIAARDSGKTSLDAMIGEVMTVCEKIRWLIACGEQHLRSESRSCGPLMGWTKTSLIEYHPCGVVGCIIPWNYPFQNIYGSILAPLFSGCGVVVKPSEWTSWSTPYFAQFIVSALSACGHSEHLVAFVTGDASTGRALVEGGVDKIIFIGSPANGRRVMEAAAAKLTPVTLELGGKDPMIICDDANLDVIVPIAMRGVFQNMGQNCIGIERIYCAAELYEEFCSRVAKIANCMRQGLPLEVGSDCGALVMPAQIDIVDGLVKEAVSKGARVLAGGERNAALFPGQFYKPTVLCDVNHSMRIVHEEVFGPVMLIIKTHSDEQALQLANDSKYALAGSVFSQSRDRAFRIARQVQGGTVLVNDFGIAYLCQELPFGGVGFSGFGKFNGPEGLRECCNQKVLMNDRFSFIKSQIPQPLQYPVSPNAVAGARVILRIIYSAGIARKLAAVTHFLKMLFGRHHK
jgi:acyl-CoA reductase-like NAD-dependent aldehyde dehydrogenase